MSYKAILNYLYPRAMGVSNSFRNLIILLDLLAVSEIEETVMKGGLAPLEIYTFTVWVWAGKWCLRALFAQVLGNCRFTTID